MAPEDRAGDGRVESAGLETSRRSFHSRLLLRSGERLVENRRRWILLRLADRWGWLGQLIGQGTIFAGGLAIGGGAMLISRGEEARALPGLLIAVGIGCVLFVIVARIAAMEMMKRGTTSARS